MDYRQHANPRDGVSQPVLSFAKARLPETFAPKDNYWLTFWEDTVVTTSTRTSLTVVSDKLKALSGISIYAMSRLRCTYIAGMWLEHLEKNLTWWSASDATASLPRVYVASSGIPWWTCSSFTAL
ncbi:hypothetical protein P3342_011911 [Pyrenophora teres f. teres]|nr:hypothetical protein P3342_011911 [Pyrenophora teres f. teres]